MPLTKDRVMETSASTGTGTINLAGAKSGYRAFSDAFATGDSVYYVIVGGAEWEVGYGTVTTGSPWTLSRNVQASSNANALVSFSAGTKDVFCAITAGTLATLATLAGAETLANKRITARIGSTASSATPAINTDLYDEYHITALAASITSMTTNLSGTPVDGDILIVEITDSGTARSIVWGTGFESSRIQLPTTTVISTKLTVTLKRNTATSKWRCVGVC